MGSLTLKKRGPNVSEPPSEEVGSLVPLRAFGQSLAFPDPLASEQSVSHVESLAVQGLCPLLSAGNVG